MVELREKYPNAGAREMISLLFHEMDMCVSRYVLIIFDFSCTSLHLILY